MVSATVTLYKDIGLDSNYNRTMYFTSKTQQTTWFNSIASSLRTTLTNVNYNKLQNSFAIHEPIGDVFDYTYCRIQNMDDSGRTYYGFVSNVTLVDDETTRFDIALDPIQTFMTEWSLGNCLVFREHCDRWGSGYSNINPIRITPNMESAVGFAEIESAIDIRQYITSESEGTDTTVPLTTCIIGFTYDFEMVDSDGSDRQSENLLKYMIIPLSQSEEHPHRCNFNVLTEDGGTTVPGGIQEMPTLYQIISGEFQTYWNINPDSIFGIWVMPFFPMKLIGGDYRDVPVMRYTDGCYGERTVETTIYGLSGSDVLYDRNVDMKAIRLDAIVDNTVGWFQVLTEEQLEKCVTGAIDNIYQIDVSTANTLIKPTSSQHPASDIYEPALYMSPFRKRYITDGFGTPILVVPDIYGISKEINYEPIALIKSTGVVVGIRAEPIGEQDTENKMTSNILNGATTVPAYAGDILSDAWKSYCLTQRESDRRMMWTNIISNTINQAVFMGYGGALVGSRSNSGKNDPLKNSGAMDVPGYGRAMASAMGFGIASSLVTSAVSGYAMWQEQEANEQTIRNQPSTLTSQSDGAVAGAIPFMFVTTKIDDVAYEKAYNDYRYYGYIVRKMEVPNIQSRYYFNYICTTNTTILGALPADVKQALVDIFEKGITLFHADHCESTEYPTFENVERAIV